MITKLARVTIIVRDHDEALDFYVGKLGLEKREDNTFLLKGQAQAWSSHLIDRSAIGL